MKSILFSVIPLVLVFYAAVWFLGQFFDVLVEMFEGSSLPLVARIVLWPQFPLIALVWVAAILGLAVALPRRRRAFWHLALWPGFILVVVFFMGVFVPMISAIGDLSAN